MLGSGEIEIDQHAVVLAAEVAVLEPALANRKLRPIAQSSPRVFRPGSVEVEHPRGAGVDGHAPTCVLAPAVIDALHAWHVRPIAPLRIVEVGGSACPLV